MGSVDCNVARIGKADKQAAKLFEGTRCGLCQDPVGMSGKGI
jgi:hypothetical protein